MYRDEIQLAVLQVVLRYAVVDARVGTQLQELNWGVFPDEAETVLLVFVDVGVRVEVFRREFEILSRGKSPVALDESEPFAAAAFGEPIVDEELFALSRRDAIIKHLVENIVPLTQDDDVFEIGSDFEYYSVVTEIPHSRWKLAIAQPFIRRVD